MQIVFATREAVQRFGRSRLAINLRNGVWQRPERGVIVTHNGPIDRATREQVLITSNCGSALGGLTALGHDGLAGFSSDLIQLVLRPGARKPSGADVEPHWSDYLDSRDVHPQRTPRRTRVARSVIDAASWTPHARYARAIVIASMQQRLTNVQQIREALMRRGNCRHRALIVQSILDAHGGMQSLPERDMREILLELGWRPTLQRHVKGKDGRYYLDVFITELNLAIEVHGIPHMAVRRWDTDLMRANEIVIAGERLLIFSSYAIRHERAAVLDQLRRFAAQAA